MTAAEAASPEASPAVAVIALSEANGANGSHKEAEQRTEQADKPFGLRKQFLACLAVLLMHLTNGVCMAYSSSLIPALEAGDSDIPVTRHQSAWLASTFVLSVPIGSLVPLTLRDRIGRLALVRFSVLPFCAGWALIATAWTFEQVVAGRLLTGAAIGVAHSPALLFIAEVADPKIRGGLGALTTAIASFGVLVCYVMGAYMHWRTHAWANCAVPVLPLVLMWVFAAESPVSLRARGRTAQAARSSLYYYNDSDKVLSSPSGSGGDSFASQCRVLFTTARGLKPLIMVQVIFAFQQITGVYITIYWAVTFFKDTGSTIDPYKATILIGVVRLVGATGVSLIMPRFGRRPLMTISSLGQAACMAVSAYATMRILEDAESMSSLWVVGSLLGYIALGCLGWQTVPWSMMAELPPHEVRPLAQPFNTFTVHILMFSMLQVYPYLSEGLGGAAGVQFLFAGTSALAAVFIVVFLPETRARTLKEIEDYFANNTVFLTERRRRRAQRRAAAKAELAKSTSAETAKAAPV